MQDQPGWDAPPAEFREVQRQGFHDGIEGARQDFDHHRMPDVNNRKEYRHPHVDPALREDYREGFRRGYEVAMHHMRDHMDDRDMTMRSSMTMITTTTMTRCIANPKSKRAPRRN